MTHGCRGRCSKPIASITVPPLTMPPWDPGTMRKRDIQQRSPPRAAPPRRMPCTKPCCVLDIELRKQGRSRAHRRPRVRQSSRCTADAGRSARAAAPSRTVPRSTVSRRA
eukprot:scaffold1167_cov154-Isochrysis_galbana.AAC.2